MSVHVLNSPEAQKIAISPERRELMHRVMDGRHDLMGVMSILHAYKYCDNFLKWLVINRYTGGHLVDLLVKKHRSSVPNLINWILVQMNSEIDELKQRVDGRQHPG
jgi:hypothetical protein